MTDKSRSEVVLTGKPQGNETHAAHVRMSGRILLAEDGLFNQMLVSTILRQRGFDLVTVDTGTAAVAHCLAAMQSNIVFDIVLMDIQMPEMDGVDATLKLRSMGYNGPIIAVTANSEHSERTRCIKAGFNEYLTKPISRQALLSKVESYIRVERGTVLPDANSCIDAQGPYSDQALKPIYSSCAHEPEMEELITRFVDGLVSQLELIRSAANDNNLSLLKRLAHQLHGAAGGYGFMPVSYAAAALEKAAKNATRTEDVTEPMNFLISVCERVRK